MFWTLQKAALRGKQAIMQVGAPFILKFDNPELLTGAGSVHSLADLLENRGITHVLLVTDNIIMDLGLAKGLVDSLEKNKIDCTVYDSVQPNPTVQNVEAGLEMYHENSCDGVIAFGGGSPMDCAKMIAARVTNPTRSVAKMRGVFKIKNVPAPLFAVPTTAGTGSETSIGAVITDAEAHEKFIIADPKLMPLAAVLDPELTAGLPPGGTAATGMDALTHALESYISTAARKFSMQKAEQATKLIFENLEAVYKDGSDLERRSNMALASFCAAEAFNTTGLGYVHAIAHNMGGLYGVPHGFANAVVLPYILEFSRQKAEAKLANLARITGVGKEGQSDEELSQAFVEKVRNMNQNLGIPTTFKEIEEKDIPLIVKRALKEGNGVGSAVPALMNKKECDAIVRKLMA